MTFAPVHLPEDRRLNGRANQTFLRHANGCLRSGYLYLKYRGEARTVEMERGRALHAVCERAIRATVEQDEPTIPPDVVKVIVSEVLADPSFAVPLGEHDYVREMSYRWAAETAVDPGAVIACESLFVLDVGGFQVRCRVDFAELLEDGAAVAVYDWKSSRAAPPFEEVARKRPDGSLAAKSFQLVLYALALAFGVQVREEGGQEFPEPFPVASRAQRFDLAFVYPGIEDRDGRMVRRPVTLTRLELEEYRASLEALIARVRHAEESGDWPAVVSDSACGECPAPSECPIPVELRDWRGTVNSPEQAADAFAVMEREKAEQRARNKELRNFVKGLGGRLRFGNGMVAEIGFQESERIADKDGLWDAVERTRLYGEPFERERFVKRVQSFPLVVRELSVDELQEVQDGREEARSADERFGADAPF